MNWDQKLCNAVRILTFIIHAVIIHQCQFNGNLLKSQMLSLPGTWKLSFEHEKYKRDVLTHSDDLATTDSFPEVLNIFMQTTTCLAMG